MTEIRVVTSGQWRAFANRLKKAEQGKTLRRALTKRLRGEMAPAVRDVQASIRDLHVRASRGGGTAARRRHYQEARPRGRVTAHGLRASIARGVKSRVKYSGIIVGARIAVDASALPADQRKLPKYLDRPRGWRHPVFGNPEAWVTQYGAPWFKPPIQRRLPAIRKAVAEAVADTLKEITS